MKCGPKAYLVSYNIPNTNIDIDVKLWADFRFSGLGYVNEKSDKADGPL